MGPGRRPASYGFLRRPIWIAGAIVALLAAALFVRLGIWQLSRHEDRREVNAVVTAALDGPLVDLTAAAGNPPPEFRQVTATGSYQRDAVVLVQNRSFRGSSGFHVLQPLTTRRGANVVVNRGWMPLRVVDEPELLAAPPRGGVVVVGRVRVGRTGGTINPAEGAVPARISTPDLTALEALWGVPLEPVYLDLVAQDPVPGPADPTPVDPPQLGPGRHLGYAFQWFAFAAIAVGGFVVLAVRTARKPAPAERRSGRD